MSGKKRAQGERKRESVSVGQKQTIVAKYEVFYNIIESKIEIFKKERRRG